MKQVRHHQKVGRHFQQRRVLVTHGDQLIERVQLHELKAGFGKDFCAWDNVECLVEDSLSARVAVMPGIAE